MDTTVGIADALTIALLTVVVAVTLGSRLQLSPPLKAWPGPTYAEVIQKTLKTDKRFMPFVLLATLLASIFALVANGGEGTAFALACVAFAAILLFFVITVAFHLPIN